MSLRPQFNNTGGVISICGSTQCRCDPHVARPGPDGWFNPAAFDQPADFTLGNASRTHPSLREPASQNHDLSMSKRFSLSASKSLEFNAVGTELPESCELERPRYGHRAARAPNVNAGKIIGSSGGRVCNSA